MSRIDEHVPDDIYRAVHHYHNMIYIKNYWESLGQPVDPIFLQELERTHAVVRKVIDRETQQGGSLRKIKDGK